MDGWVWSNGGMILTGETEVLGEKHYTLWVVDGWMSMEQWWNDTDRGNWSTGRKTCPNATLSTTNLTCDRTRTSAVTGWRITPSAKHITLVYKDSVCTAQRTQSAAIRKTSQLKLYREIRGSGYPWRRGRNVRSKRRQPQRRNVTPQKCGILDNTAVRTSELQIMVFDFETIKVAQYITWLTGSLDRLHTGRTWTRPLVWPLKVVRCGGGWSFIYFTLKIVLQMSCCQYRCDMLQPHHRTNHNDAF